MSLQGASQAASYDQSAVYKLDLSEVVASILLDDTDFLSTIGVSEMAASQTKHEWIEDALNATNLTSLNGSLAAASGAVGISASHLSRITAGTLLRDQLSGKTEVMQVTAVGAISATITRGYGSSSAESHAANAVYEIIANPRPQGMAGPKDESVARSKPYNQTQIFSKGVKITGTAESIDHAGVTSEQQYQIDMRLRELMRELDRAAIMGIRSASQPSDSVYGTMGGAIEWATLLNTGNLVSSAETLTPAVLNTLAKKCWDSGLTPNMVLVGGVQKQKIAQFDQEFRRSTLDSRRAGFTVEEFVTDLGINLQIVIDRWVPNDVAIVFSRDQVKIMPLTGRSFFLEALGKTGDSHDWQIVGEYTLEFKNADAAAAHTNLKQ